VDLLRKAGAPEPKKLGVAVPAEQLARLAGLYAGPGIGEATVSLEQGKLMLKAGGEKFELLAYDALNFASPAMPGMKMEFAPEGDKAKTLKVSGNGMNTVLNRVEGK
jgi:hypothetical protein